MFILKKIQELKQIKRSTKILFVILVSLWLIVSGILYYTTLNSPLPVKISFSENSTQALKIECISLRGKKISFKKKSNNTWESGTFWIKKIIIQYPQKINISTQNIVVEIGEKKIQISENDLSPIAISSLELSPIIKSSENIFDLLNYNFNLKKFLLSFFGSACILMVLFVFFYLVFLLLKSIKTSGKLNPFEKSDFPNSLEISVVLFLAIPCFIFIIGWIKWYYSVPTLLLFLYSFYTKYIQKFSHTKGLFCLKRNSIIMLFIISFCLIFISGMGGFGFQNHDWVTKNIYLTDLATKSWPLKYQISNEPDSPLVYYMAYYIFPGFVGKIAGLKFVNLAVFIESLFGLILLFLCLIRIVNKKQILLIILICILFSGIDFAGDCIVNDHSDFFNGAYRGWWYKIQFMSFGQLLCWVPQHMFSGILSVMIVWNYIATRQSWVKSFFVLAVSSFWSFYVPLGLIPFVCLHLFLQYKEKYKSEKYSALFILSIILILVNFFYYASISKGIETDSVINYSDFLSSIYNYSVFTILEWSGLFIIVLYAIRKQNSSQNQLFFLSGIVLFLIPFIKAPSYSDFCMKASIPSLFIVCIFVIKVLLSKETKKGIWVCIIIILLAGINTPMNEFIRSVKFISREGIHSPLNEIKVESTVQQTDTSNICFSRKESFFNEFLCK